MRVLVVFLGLVLSACAGSANANGGSLDGSVTVDPGPFGGGGDECGNGIDDDGDGDIDERCPCGRGETQSCFSGQHGERGVGVCGDGTQTCVVPGTSEFGTWGSCEGDTRPTVQQCEGLDEDCDGAIDEGCPCTAGQSQECGVEFLIAPCTGGTQSCLPNGTWSGCDGAVRPEAEVCDDGVDNDCDGEEDECFTCDPSPEQCGDGYDNDCDGDIDEPACTTGLPVPGPGPECEPTAASETCGNGADDNCDGFIDESCDCAAVAAPRPISPLSTARVTRQKPTFTWELASGVEEVRIEICADRPCTVGVISADVTGTSWAPPANLPTGVLFWRLRGVNGAEAGCETSPTWQFIVGPRSTPVDTSWGSVTDPNGDGFADLLVAPSWDGPAYLYLGSTAGISATSSGRYATPGGSGAIPRGAGDVNGDGFADIAIGGQFSRSANIHFGGPTGPSSAANQSISGPGSSTQGWAHIASAGDINRDGYGDLVVVAPAPSEPHRLLVYFGSAAGLSASPSQELHMGDGTTVTGNMFVDGAGDVNGDGYGDVIVGHILLNAVLIYHGGPDGLPSEATTILVRFDSAFGITARGAGDVNGDGYADVMATSSRGSPYVYYGSSTGVGTAGSELQEATDYSITYVDGAGDVNGDGFADLVVGNFRQRLDSPSYIPPEGKVLLYLGGPGGVTSPAMFLMEKPETMYGLAVEGLGDVNGDLRGDIAFGATRSNSPSAGHLPLCEIHVHQGGADAVIREVKTVVVGTLPCNNVDEGLGGAGGGGG